MKEYLEKRYSCPHCRRQFTLLDYSKSIGFGVFHPACCYGGLVEIKCRSCGSESCPRRPYALNFIFAVVSIIILVEWVYLVSVGAISFFTLPLLVVSNYCMQNSGDTIFNYLLTSALTITNVPPWPELHAS